MSEGNVIYLTDDPAARSKQGYQVVRADKAVETAVAANSSLSWFVGTKPVYQKMISSIADSNADLIAELKDVVLIIETKFRKDPHDRTPESLFRSVIEIDPKTALPFEEFMEIRKEAHPEDFIIGGRVNSESKTITLYRGDFSPLLVSFARFKKNAVSEPDFAKFKVVDHGMGIRLGDYEASIYPILYELDSSYRIRVNMRTNLSGLVSTGREGFLISIRTISRA